MNGARRGAPGAGAFGAFRPPPPPGSQFTTSRFSSLLLHTHFDAELFCEFHGEIIIIIIAHGESGRQFLTMSKIWITMSKTINRDNDVQT